MIRLVPVQDDARWDAVLADQPHASICHTSQWLRLQERHHRARLHPLVVEQAGRAIGLFPLLVLRRGMLRVNSSILCTETLKLGPLVPAETLGDVLEAYERYARRHRFDYSDIAFCHDLAPELARRLGYRLHVLRTPVVDLRAGEESAWARLKSRRRGSVRKARRMGVTAGPADPRACRGVFNAMVEDIYARSGHRPRMTWAFFEDMCDTLAGRDRLLCLRAEADGQPVSACAYARLANRLLSLTVWNDPRFRNFAANSLLHWEAIAWGCRNGLEALDLSSEGGRGIIRFKGSFGCEWMPYARIQKSNSRLGSAAEWLYTRGRPLIGALRRALRRRPSSPSGRPASRSDPS